MTASSGVSAPWVHAFGLARVRCPAPAPELRLGCGWKRFLLALIFLSALLLSHFGPACASASAGPAVTARITVSAEPLQAGTINPRLFGNFIELLDDVVPGMWAELLNDRSFEGVIPTANWCYYDGSPDICDREWETNSTWQIDEDKPFNGARCAKVSARSGPGTLTQSGLAIRKDATYVFSGYFHAEPGVRASVLLKVLLPDGSWMTLASAGVASSGQGWQRCSARLISAGSTDQAVFELRAEGVGALWCDKLSLMPADNVRGWRPDVVEAVKDLRPGIIRWGGSAVDPGGYRWKEGIGERDLRVPFRNRNWGRVDPNDVGIDEFCQFCEVTASDPLICVSFADGPESAAELVSYCNGREGDWAARRAANGHPLPYAVKYWQIGNEIGGDDPNYLKQLPRFISLMKKADPGIRVLTSFPSQALLELAGGEIGYVCPHHYTPDLAFCERDLSSISGMLDHTPGCSGIRVAVTEWNIDAGAWGLGRAKMATLEGALANARYLHVLMRHCDKVEIACRSNLANSFCGGLFETGPSGLGILKRPSYYVMRLYAHNTEPIPLRTEGATGPLDVFGCGSRDGKGVALFAVNPTTESVPLSVAFKGFSVAPRPTNAETVCDGRNAGQPDVCNHWASEVGGGALPPSNPANRVSNRPLACSSDPIVLPPLSASALRFRID